MRDVVSPRKIVQIAAATAIDGEDGAIGGTTECYALDDRGDVWNYRLSSDKGWYWAPLPSLPEDDE